MNSLVDLTKKNKKPCFIFKVDFEKGYDPISWSFLDCTLFKFSFNDKWRNWIHAHVFFGNLAVLVNGYSIQEISIQRGLKQGDPLAPFLFLLVAEGLSGIFYRVVDQQIFLGLHVRSSNLVVFHLEYADDK